MKKISILILFIIFFEGCKKEQENNSILAETTTDNEISFDEVLKCSEYIFSEGYYVTPDYGCIYNPKGDSKFGNVIIYLIPKNKSISQQDVNSLSEDDIKKQFNIVVYLIRKEFLNYNPDSDPVYYQKDKYNEEVYIYEKEKWIMADSIQIKNSSQNEKEQIWREAFLNKMVNNNSTVFSLPNNLFVYDSASVIVNNKKYEIYVLEKSDLKDAENAQHNSNSILILSNQVEGLIKLKENNKIVFAYNSNCPSDGFEKIVAKNEYFTIEQSFCASNLFVNSYTTFKIDDKTNAVLLSKYGEEYTDRNNPEKDLPTKTWTSKDFGKVNFEDVNETFIIKLKNN